MARPKVTTTTRHARGRERALSDTTLPLALAAALDALARHRAAGEPLDRCVADVARARHLGPRERRALGDAVFSFARLRVAVDALVDEALAKSAGIKPSRRDRDLCAIVLAQLGSGVEVDPRVREKVPPGPLLDLVDDVAARGLPARATLPPWLGEAIARAHVDAAALIDALQKPAPLVLAVDRRHASVDDVVAALGKNAQRSPLVHDAVRVTGRIGLRALPAALRAHVWPMDDGSQAVALAVDARPGELVLDLCAGGGGKSRLLATTGARVVSADVHAERLRAGGDDLARVVTDGRAPAFRRASFDRVLVDAPCTGTGTLRRAPDLAERLAPDDVARFAELQRALLLSALDLVKPGGLVVYATCSLLREENDDVVDAVLRERPSLHPVSLATLWGDRVHTRESAAPRAHMGPHIDGSDGFFLAALRT